MPFVSHDHIGAPPGNAIIWRYMGLDKFLDLIANSRLYFADVHSLPDKYEATLPDNLALKHAELIKKERADDLSSIDRSLLEKMNQAINATALVNCWSRGQTESYALWKVYLGGSQAGVAIRTDLSNLRRAIELGGDLDELEIYTGQVQYMKRLAQRFISVYSLVTIKREFYKYEKEMRLFILDPPDTTAEISSSTEMTAVTDPDPGCYVKVNVPTLIEELYLSPFLRSWFKDAVVKILENVQPELLDPTPDDRIKTSSILDS
jgi:hypothetical protein